MPLPTSRRRNRALYVFFVLFVIGAGLASRKYSHLLPQQLGKYPGDALWALMVFLLYGLARPNWSVITAASAALATSYAVEFSQLYQATWLNSIRHTTAGHLVLGSAFHAQDLLAYATGVTAGALAELYVSRRPAVAVRLAQTLDPLKPYGEGS